MFYNAPLASFLILIFLHICDNKHVETCCCPIRVCMTQICCRLAILLQYYMFCSVPLALHVQVVGLVKCIAWKIWGNTHVIQNNPKETHKWQEDCLESVWSLSRGNGLPEPECASANGSVCIPQWPGCYIEMCVSLPTTRHHQLHATTRPRHHMWCEMSV